DFCLVEVVHVSTRAALYSPAMLLTPNILNTERRLLPKRVETKYRIVVVDKEEGDLQVDWRPIETSSQTPLSHTKSPVVITPERSTPERLALVRSAPSMMAPRRLAPVRLASERFEQLRSAPAKLAPVRSLAEKSAPWRLAPVKS